MQWSGTQKRQARVGDAPTESNLRVAASLECVDQGQREVEPIVGAAVGQPGLGEIPNLLVRVEFRRVGRKVLESETRNPATQVLNRRQAMQAQSIPEHDHRTAKVTQQVGEKLADLGLADVV